ncbi:MAG: hypothetical protein U0570_08545 [Phycisphaerales bacterium]
MSTLAAESPSTMFDFFLHLFDPTDPPASSRGGGLSSVAGWLHLSSDMSISFAYAVLCVLLMMFLSRQRDLPHRTTLWMIWLFLLACGVTRFTSALMLYYPAFRLLLVVKVLTGAVSLVTIFSVARIFPSLLGLAFQSAPAPAEVADADRFRAAEAAFSDQREKLEQRATQLTVRDRRIRRAMETSCAAAVSWSGTSDRILWEAGLKELLRNESEQPIDSWSQLIPESLRDSLVEASNHAITSGTDVVIDLAIDLPGCGLKTLHLRAKTDVSDRTALTGLAWLRPC